MSEKTKIWIKAAGVRAAKTVAQTAVATFGTALALSGVDWKFTVSASLLAGLTSLFMSVAGLPEVSQKSVGQSEADEPEAKMSRYGTG